MDTELKTLKYPGKYLGFVRDNADPEKRCRIRCFCPEVMGGVDRRENWLGWADACLPWVGGLSTLDFGVPPTKAQNDGEEVAVWLEFKGGNPDFPIWVGMAVVAPTVDGVRSQLDLTNAAGRIGGTILVNPPSGSDVADFNPPKPEVPDKETRLMAKKGRDIVIGSAGGGYVVIGPSGVNFTGVNVTINGRSMSASLDKVVG